MECIECYSENNRITPLLKARNCLENHEQYICGTCGRCICIDKDKSRNVPLLFDTDMKDYSDMYQHFGCELYHKKTATNNVTRYNLVWEPYDVKI